MTQIKIWLDDNGVASLLRTNPKLETMERELAERKKSEIEASFLQSFGTSGTFVIKAVQTRPGKKYGRLSYRITAGDKKTGYILKQHPGWLSNF